MIRIIRLLYQFFMPSSFWIDPFWLSISRNVVYSSSDPSQMCISSGLQMRAFSSMKSCRHLGNLVMLQAVHDLNIAVFALIIRPPTSGVEPSWACCLQLELKPWQPSDDEENEHAGECVLYKCFNSHFSMLSLYPLFVFSPSFITFLE